MRDYYGIVYNLPKGSSARIEHRVDGAIKSVLWISGSTLDMVKDATNVLWNNRTNEVGYTACLSAYLGTVYVLGKGKA